MRQASPRPQARERQPSPRAQRPEQTSPRPRQASPRPVPVTREPLKERQSSPRPPVTARERPKERQPSPRPTGAMTTRDQPIVRERPAPRDRSSGASYRPDRAPSTPQRGQLARSQSARRSLDGPSTDLLTRSMSRGPSQRSGTHLGLRSLVSSLLQLIISISIPL